MIISNFIDDLISLLDFSNRDILFIEVEHQFVDGTLVIEPAQNMDQEKTMCFRMLKNDLQKRNSIRPSTSELDELIEVDLDLFGSIVRRADLRDFFYRFHKPKF